MNALSPDLDVECSVIVPTHRGAHRLPELLDALASQDYGGVWELIVVVDGVLDSTVELVDSYRDRLPLILLVHDEPRGVVAAMNDGIRAANGRIIIRCDDDLTPAPFFLRVHMKHHSHGRLVGVIGPTRDVFPDSPYARAYGEPATARSLAAAYAREASYRWIGWAANNSVSRQVLTNLKGFDPRFVYGQDSELGYRIASLGIEIIVDETLETPHRGPSTSLESRAPRAFVSGASRKLFDQIHPGAHPPPPSPSGLRSKIWQLGVRAIAGMMRTRETYARVGRIIDRLLGVLPQPIASRLVAILVEAAGKSGRAHGNDDLSVYKLQKTTELKREIVDM